VDFNARFPDAAPRPWRLAKEILLSPANFFASVNAVLTVQIYE
jgi:hypothetical protein